MILTTLTANLISIATFH